MQLTSHASRFQAGGTLAAGKLYIRRRADEELEQRLREGDLCAVLAPRQIGKSSLQVRTAERLCQSGFRCVNIDLTTIGITEVSADSFYASLCKNISRQLGLPDSAQFWQDNRALSPVARWTSYLQERVLALDPRPLVLFIDEVDAVRASPWRDEFFAAIRGIYNLRSISPEFCSLTFCLVGAALPADLISDAQRTPFNVGHSIQIEDFSREQLSHFAAELRPAGGDPEVLLDAIYHHTGGHPYMTQRLCEALVEVGPRRPSSERWAVAAPAGCASEAERVAELVGELFLSSRTLEKALEATERCFRGPGTVKLLALYQRVRAGEAIIAQPQEPTQMALRMSGLVVDHRDAPRGVNEQHGAALLRVRNRVYERRFDLAWVRALEAEQLIAQPLSRWTEFGQHRDFLLRGAALQEALRWAEHAALTGEEQRFLTAAQEAERAEREHQQTVLFTTETLKSFANYLALAVLSPYLDGYLPASMPTNVRNALQTLVYLCPLVGGLWGDLRLGHRRSVQIGIGSLLLGYLLLSTGQAAALTLGLTALVVGNLFYKPNLTTLVGSVRAKGDAAQVDTFLGYFVALNVGSLGAHLVAPTVKGAPRSGFLIAAVAMVLCFSSFQGHLDREPYFKPVEDVREWLRRDRTLWSRRSGVVLLLCGIFLCFLPAFNMGSKIAAKWLLLAPRPTARHPLLDSLLALLYHAEIVESMLAILLAPLVWWVLGAMRRRGREPSMLDKLKLVLVLTAGAFFIMLLADGPRISLFWVLTAYLLAVLAEVLLVPIAYAILIKLSPRRYVSTMMGVWFATVAVGNGVSLEPLWVRWPHRWFLLLLLALIALCLSLVHRFAPLMVEGRVEEFDDAHTKPFPPSS